MISARSPLALAELPRSSRERLEGASPRDLRRVQWAGRARDRLTLAALWAFRALALGAALCLVFPPSPARSQTGDAQLEDQLRLKRSRLAAHVRHFAEARALAAPLFEGDADPNVEDLANADAVRLECRATVRTRAIGLLAPLSGPYSGIGEDLLRGAKTALQRVGGPELVVEDSQGTPEGAAAAVEALVLRHGVVAILGPIGNHESRAAALRASELEVPTILMASASDLASLSPWAFRHRISPADQARAVARHALEDLNLRRFAFLYPDDSYGLEMVNAFWDEVVQAGGEIRGAEAFASRSRDTSAAVRRLVGGHFKGAREDEFELHGRGKKQLAFRPIVDFEALFLPDGPARSRKTIASLNYYDVSLRGFERHRRRAAHSPVQILGPGSWNSPVLGRGAEELVQNARFPGALLLESARPEVRSFVRTFRRMHRRRPNEFEAQAHDAAGWLWLAWSQGRSRGRLGVRNALASLGGFRGVTGTVRVQQDGSTRTELSILTVRGDRILSVSEPQGGGGVGSPGPAPPSEIRFRPGR